MLCWVLKAVGLTEISFHDYGESKIPDLQGLEQHGGWEMNDGFPSVWIVEAVRSAAPLALDQDAAERIRKAFSSHVSSGH
jgi:hypothetical protein